MDLAIDHESPVPPFEQLRATVAARVTDGSLPAGTKLPTVRALATDLGLAANTVARAYRELEADGVVVTEGRRGTFVASDTLARTPTELASAAAGFARAARRHGVTRAEALRLVDDAWDR